MTPETSSIAHELGFGVVQWLCEHQMESGAIRGDHGAASPHDHYAHSFAALAFGQAAELQESQALWENCEKALRYTLSISANARRKQEFNSLALLLLIDIVRASKQAPRTLVSTLEHVVYDRKLLYDGGRLVSNNWLTMRAVCFLAQARLMDDPELLQRGIDLLNETLKRQLSDGIFVDFPAEKRAGREYATPLTYHAKICAMLALAIRQFPSGTSMILPALKRGLRALISIMSPRGECLYYGRSCNSLFGISAAFFALRCMDSLDPSAEWSLPADRVLELLADRRNPDGHLSLTPVMDDSVDRSGWDIYYHTEVYNAYAAALLLAAPIAVERHTIVVPEPGCVELPDAGILTISAPDFFIGISTNGQCVPDGSSLFCDMRYAGMQPLLVQVGGLTVVPEPPLKWTGPSTKAEAVSPELTGFMPYLSYKGSLYCSRVFYQTRHVEFEAGHIIFGRGAAISLSLPPRAIRLVRRIRGRLTGKGDLAFTPHALQGFTFTRAILVLPRHKTVIIVDGFEGTMPAGAIWCGPNARLLKTTSLAARDLLVDRPFESGPGAPTSRGQTQWFGREFTPVTGGGVVSAVAISPSMCEFTAVVGNNVIEITGDRLVLVCDLDAARVDVKTQ